MKKIVCTIGILLIAVCGAFAQYRFDPMVWTMEVLFNPLSTTSNNAIDLPAYGAKGRLFFNDSWCLRLQLGFDNTNKEVKDYANNSDDYTKTVTDQMMVTFFPGFEYHFEGNDRISPYIGMDLGFGIYNNRTELKNSTTDNKSVVKGTDYLLGLNVVTGVDVFLYRGLYMGVEIGLGVNNLRENSNTTDVTVDGATDTSKSKDFTNTNEVGFNVVPAIRLGWSF